MACLARERILGRHHAVVSSVQKRNASASVPRTLPTWANAMDQDRTARRGGVVDFAAALDAVPSGNDISMHREAPSVLRRADRELPLEYTAQVLFIAVTRVRGNALER
ncbi:MAG: hypothetical protein JWN85_1170 [Gammaproteobacteria bacterium]|nr:hypothetical protein [Gammaproteobacteria bacterium]